MVIGRHVRIGAMAGAAVAASLLGVPAVAATSATASAAAGAPVPGAVPTLVKGAVDLGPAPSEPMVVTAVLTLHDTALLDQSLKALYTPGNPRFHHFLTPSSFDAAYGPSPSAVKSVSTWAGHAGLSVVSVSANRMLVHLTGEAGALGRAFGVTIDRFKMPSGATYLSNTTAARLPAALSGYVASVVGLSTLGQAQLAPVATPAATLSYPTSYGPSQFASIYDAPSSDTGASQTIAILAEGDLSQPQRDLRTFESSFHLPQVPWTTIPVGSASTDTSGDDEWDLDTQYSTGFAPGVSSLLVYDTTSLSDSDILAEMNRFVTDDLSRQASFSAGECEVLADTDGFVASGDQVLKEAVAQGQTLFAASGDTGSFCPALVSENGVPAGLPDVDYPASSPYAVGVGGTTLLGLPSPLHEVAWYAGGGGQSLLEAEPSYQSSVGGENLGIRRGVPDVALDADPESGYEVVVGGRQETVGGTSASSPSWLGIWARTQAAHASSLGFANDTIYAEPASSFHDIVVGANGLYTAGPGYDYITGRGTPDITAFVNGA